MENASREARFFGFTANPGPGRHRAERNFLDLETDSIERDEKTAGGID